MTPTRLELLLGFLVAVAVALSFGLTAYLLVPAEALPTVLLGAMGAVPALWAGVEAWARARR
jgi:hypothetical protein